jgi:adenylosuccinate lyase
MNITHRKSEKNNQLKEGYDQCQCQYQNPLIARYGKRLLTSYIWSPQYKFSTWRSLWIALAKGQQKLGLNITDEQIQEMESNEKNIDFDLAEKYEKQVRHDVMAHIHAWSEQCPKAKRIIHLGATSCFVGDNTDLFQIRESFKVMETQLVHVMRALSEFALKYKSLPTLGYTHFQAAQLVTVGKRAALWLQDFQLDYKAVTSLIKTLPFRGIKGTTGTQASFLELFDGDHEKVKALDEFVTHEFGFEKSIDLSGQTYTRKLDSDVLHVLLQIATSAEKFATDMRLLMHEKEIEEPFDKDQIGSSAMAYKRNPMRSERICSLARFVMSLYANGPQTASHQWFERTLDDSANRRLTLPQSFLGVEVILDTVLEIVKGMVVYEKVIATHVEFELPFMATENILMECVKAGGDRQELHERIRVLSMEADRLIKVEGQPTNSLIGMILADETFQNPKFAGVMEKLREKTLIRPKNFIGRCPEQVNEYIEKVIQPILKSTQQSDKSTVF